MLFLIFSSIFLLVIDASGRVQPGFVWGHNYWISPKETCQVLREQSDKQYSDRFKRRNLPNLLSAKPPFDVNYQVVYLEHRSIYQIDQKIFEKVSMTPAISTFIRIL